MSFILGEVTSKKKRFKLSVGGRATNTFCNLEIPLFHLLSAYDVSSIYSTYWIPTINT